jgi:hypothetical protein
MVRLIFQKHKAEEKHVHRGTAIEDAGYKIATRWPVVPDIRDAQDGKKYIRYTLIATIPAMAAAFFILMLSGVGMPFTLIGPAVILVLSAVIVIRFKKLVHNLIVNCKMVKAMAEMADADVEHTAKVVFEAVTRKGETERIEPINDGFGVYVNAGYKMDNGRVELPYIIFIRKVQDSEKAAAA